MRLAAQYQAVIELVDLILTTNWPADRLTQDYFRNRRFMGSKDRRYIADVLFDILRYQLEDREIFKELHITEPLDGRLYVLCKLCRDASHSTFAPSADQIFTGQGYAPSPLSSEEKDILEKLAQYPDKNKKFVVPAFLAHLKNNYSEDFFAAFYQQAPLDLRVSLSKISREEVLTMLHHQGIEAKATPYSPAGLRLKQRYPIESLSLYKQGMIEIQDEGSQLVSYLACLEKEGALLDLCAGTGGKSLHLAELLQNQGQIIATDISPSRLERCATRVKRSQLANIKILPLEQACQSLYDCVLVDAPCSGSGTWRRHPELKSRLTEGHLKELQRVQQELLQKASQLVLPTGKIVYITCSIIPEENEQQINLFLQRHPDFKQAISSEWLLPKLVPFIKDESLRLSPFISQTDGFYATTLIRR